EIKDLKNQTQILNKINKHSADRLITANKKNILLENQVQKGKESKNPLQTTKEAMVEATLKLKIKPDLCLVDSKEEIIEILL
ncbi:30044_t:CDS:1, partial [Racocetra persica]